MSTGDLFQLADGRKVPVIAQVEGHDYVAFVLLVEDHLGGQWWVHWTDGINWWLEEFVYTHHAFAYLAALVHAADNDEFLRTRDEVVLAAGVFVEAAIRSDEHTCGASCVGGPCA